MGEGCYRYNKNSKPACFSFQEHKLPLVGISDIAECKDGILFVYDTGLLVCVDRDRLTVRWIKEEVKNDNQDGKQIDFSLFVDREECIWIYSISGVWVYDLEKGKWQEDVTERWRNRSDFVHSITQDAKGRIWMGKDYSGIDILTKADGRVVSVSSEKNQTGAYLIIRFIRCIQTEMELYGLELTRRVSLTMAKAYLSSK